MDKKKLKEEYLKLVEEINKYDLYYYEYANPLISDYEFDVLYKKLEEFEKAHPELIVPNSRTQRVGLKPVGDLEQVKHDKKLLSLDNSYSLNELFDFIQRIMKNTDRKFSLVFEPKIDGAAISLIYLNGKLETAVTRGDGLVGENVTHNVKMIATLPEKIDFKERLVLRGEVYMRKSVFKKLNEERAKNDLSLFANPRNTAAGSLKLKDPNLSALRNLDIFIYGIAEGMRYDNHYDDLKYFKDLGFPINLPKIVENISNKNEIENAINYYRNLKNDIDYEIDGVVVKVNEYDVRKELGETVKYPRWAIAYKFPAEQVTTKVLNVRFQVGRTGVLTPVADLEPVHIAGSVVSHATLHNLDEIKRLDVKIGDKVFIEKSGEIIPKIISVIKEARDGNEKDIEIPEKCPSCGEKLKFSDNNINLICENKNCPDRVKAMILHFASRDALDIKGLGKKIVSRFVDTGILKSINDLFRLKKEDIENLEGFGKLSAENLIKSIENSKNKPFSRVLYALGIPNVGFKTAEVLANHFGSIENLISASEKELTDIHDIGEIVAKSIKDALNSEEYIKLIEEMKKFGYNFKKEDDENVSNILEGTFLITGTLSKPRKEIEDIIVQNGGKILKAVSKNLDYLIVGEKPGSKLKKAKELDIKILSEEDFYRMLKGE